MLEVDGGDGFGGWQWMRLRLGTALAKTKRGFSLIHIVHGHAGRELLPRIVKVANKGSAAPDLLLGPEARRIVKVANKGSAAPGLPLPQITSRSHRWAACGGFLHSSQTVGITSPRPSPSPRLP